MVVKVGLQTKRNFNLKDIIEKIKNKEVLVGIPSSNNARKDTQDVTNSDLLFFHSRGTRRNSMIGEMSGDIKSGTLYSKAHDLYVQSHGSPLWHSPPRPVIEPAIEEHKDTINDMLKKAYKKALEGDMQGFEDGLSKTGMHAQNISREWFDNPKNNWPPNHHYTIKEKGSDRPLVDIGIMRDSITYVVR